MARIEVGSTSFLYLTNVILYFCEARSVYYDICVTNRSDVTAIIRVASFLDKRRW